MVAMPDLFSVHKVLGQKSVRELWTRCWVFWRHDTSSHAESTCRRNQSHGIDFLHRALLPNSPPQTEEMKFSKGLHDFQNDYQRDFISHVLAFFAVSDGIVNENVVERSATKLRLLKLFASTAFKL